MVVAVVVMFQAPERFHVETESYIRPEPDSMMRQIRADAPRTASSVAFQVRASTVEAPPPTPVQPVASSVVQAPVDRDRLELVALAASYFPDDERMWRHVIWAEAIGDWNPNWECTVYGPCMSPTSDCGLAQIHWPVHGGKFDWNLAACFDPAQNLAVARQIYDTQGPCAWTTYGC